MLLEIDAAQLVAVRGKAVLQAIEIGEQREGGIARFQSPESGGRCP